MFSPIKLTHKFVDTIIILFLTKDMIVSGHNSFWGTIMCLGTNVTGHSHVCAQSCLGTNVSWHCHACVQSCGHNNVWAQMCLCTNMSRHSHIWA